MTTSEKRAELSALGLHSYSMAEDDVARTYNLLKATEGESKKAELELTKAETARLEAEIARDKISMERSEQGGIQWHRLLPLIGPYIGHSLVWAPALVGIVYIIAVLRK